MPLRRAANLAAWLPAGAAVHHSEESDEAWTTSDHLASAGVYVAAVGNWQRGGGKGTKPKPIATPGEAAREHAQMARTADQAKAAKARQEARRKALGQE